MNIPWNKGKHISEEHRAKISKARTGVPRSEETKRKLSEAHKGKHLSEEHKRKIGDAGQGKRYPPKTEETRQKISAAMRGRHLSEEHKKKIGDGCRGMVMPEEAKRKISLSQQGPSNFMRGRTGDRHPLYGKHHTAEAKEKMRKARLGKKPANAGKPGKRGPQSNNWKGGITPVRKAIRESLSYQKWRKGCFERDHFTCQECGVPGGALNAHHKKTFVSLLREAVELSPLLQPYDAVMAYEPFWVVGNGVTLCEECHKSVKHRYKQCKLAA